MAGDWIKMRTRLADERATMMIIEMTGLDSFAVVGRLHAVWAWVGEHTVSGDIAGVTCKTVDRIAACDGFAKAMIAAGWLEEPAKGGLRFPRFKKYNGKAAKQRALANERQARCREKKSRAKRDTSVTSNASREEKTRGDERREEKNLIIDRNEENHKSCQSSPVVPSILEISVPGGGNLTKVEPVGVDWDDVRRMAEAVGRMIPPHSEEDRRQWFQYAVIAQRHLSEHWLLDAAAAAVQAKDRRGTVQRFFVGVLIKTGSEIGVDVDGLRKAMQIPIAVWKSDSIQVKK